MGEGTELILLPERHIVLGPTQKIVQVEAEAVDVYRFKTVVPVIRIKLGSLTPPIPGQGGSGYTMGGNGITVGFLGASRVAYRDESHLAGSRWLALAETRTITSSTAPSGGVTVGIAGSGLAALGVVPGLILATIASEETSLSQSVVLEIALICREC